MTKKDQTHSPDNLALFREKVTAARRRAGRLQRELAKDLSIDSQVLSRKLHGARQAFPTHTEVKQIIKSLAAWDAIATRAEADELLTLMGLKPNSFSEQEWQSAPLKRLEVSPPTTFSPMTPSPNILQITTSLPAPPTPLIGREYHVQILVERLRQASVRLMTLRGTGGVGKTRLALEVAHAARHDFADGVFFVPLATIYNVALIPSSIVQALQRMEHMAESSPNRPSNLSHEDMLKQFLRNKQMLLILDNVEQIPEIASFVSNMLSSTRTIKIMVTSRTVLHLYGEYEFDVPPLAVCAPDQSSDLAYVVQFAAIQLFIERAQAVNPTLPLTQDTIAVISQICTRLDGLPLAIELAAARTKVMSLPKILQRLNNQMSLPLLRTTTRNTLQRHQSLQATLDWSYGLLDAHHQTLFRRYSVFLGGWTVEAALAVVMADNHLATLDDIFEQMETLIDQSLVKRMPQGESLEPRFSFLETIREFGQGQLEANGEREVMQRWHAAYYRTFAEDIAPPLFGPEQATAVALVTQEQDNLRTALAWAIEHNEAEIVLHISSTLGRFQEARNHFHEAHRWIDNVFRMKTETPAARRANLLMGAARLARWEEEQERSRALAQEALQLYEEAGDQIGRTWALFQIGDTWHMHGDYAQASQYLEESLQLLREQEDWRNYTFTLSRLGALAALQGNIQQARVWLDEAIILLREYNEPGLLNVTLVYLAIGCVIQDDLTESITYLREGLRIAQQTSNHYMLATDLTIFGCVLGLICEPSYAAHICSAAEELYEKLNASVPDAYRPLYNRKLAEVKARADTASWEKWWDEGRLLSADQACILALSASETTN
ncbi:ATP-binding protein [Dictyobacter arantiisoli]|uniref:Uncharacterized protein n=1 Tax=Dictyobacter arantiisoli TaxID=2014874 RepID=A0A5A5TGW9_9CHLR|nr:NB-ARC domain-containing protein [Dictyobacter arantiisoli]GCF10458.1 hypothetical protein KDI_40220 [Dictyobacter arantiisoli]